MTPHRIFLLPEEAQETASPTVSLSDVQSAQRRTGLTDECLIPPTTTGEHWSAEIDELRSVLDPCCGSRMWWFDRQSPYAIYGDRRAERLTVTDRSHGNASGERAIYIEPDQLMDFRALPFPDGRFKLVAFDPPHLVRAGPRSWLAAKYGKLGEDWRDDLRQGFAECFRVLEASGVLVFKWNETQIKVGEVLALTPHQPLFGQVSGRSGMTHFMVFMKPATPKETSNEA